MSSWSLSAKPAVEESADNTTSTLVLDVGSRVKV